MSNGVPLGGSSAYNSYNAAAFAAQFAARTAAAAAAAAAASKPKDPQQPKPAKQVVDDEDEIADDVAEYDNFANVSTADLETLGLIEHPSPACEAASLSSVPSPDCDYTVKLPSKVLQTGAISALQFQAVRLACARHELRLPGGERAGFFLGDGPGVGKGRQIAATIFNYFCRGKTKALWVSVSGDLVVDARRDIDALGMLDYDAVRLHDLRTLKPKKDQKLSDLPGMDKGIAFCTYDLLVSGATRKPKKTKAKKGKAWSGLGLNMSFEEEEEEPEEFGPTSRLSQICEWLSDGDYVVVFDECHKAKNCITKESNVFPIQTEEQQEGFGGNSFGEGAAKDGMKRVQGSSKTSRAVVELQRRLPDARILYVSATGASEAENLCYMERLGLWGPGAAFPNKKEFVALLKQGGMGALELVAMELKGAGAFVSRALSWTGVRFETVAIDASPEFLEMYNAAVDVWQDTRQYMDAHCPGSSRLRTMAQFYAAQLRFFRQLCTAAKVDTVVELCLQALAAGQCPVIGLQSTGEARTAAYVKAAQTNKEREGSYDGEEAGQGEFDSFVEPAGLILSSFIEKHLMEGGGAEDLLERAKSLVLPKNPLDDLIERLGGPDAVAEMTGRQKRMEKQPKGGYSYISRAAQYGRCSLDDVNILERNAFQTGSKRVAIISDAASAGISLHADKGTANQAQRVHITLELAWSADATVQQLGRTHRSNQVSCPIYKIVSSNICGEHRFASAVAHRLQQLGALTQGDRRAASASEAMAGFNLQTLWARTALRLLVDLIVTGGAAQAARDDRVETFASLDPPFLEEMMREGLPEDQDPPLPGTNSYAIRRKAAMIRWCDAAQSQLSAVGLLNGKSLTTNKLLNRLLGMHVERQGQIFGYFSTILDKVVADAKREGRYDATGIIKPGCESIEFKETTELIQHPNGAAPTCHTEFAVDRGCPWEKAKKLLDEELERVRAAQGETAMQQCGAGFYFTDSATTRYVILALPKSDKGSKSVRVRGVAFDRAKYFKIVRPATGCTYEKSWGDLHLGYTRINNPAVAEREWRSYWGSAAGQKLRMQPLHLLTGSVLPLLPAIQKVAERHRGFGGRVQRLKLMRVETSGANMQRFIGLHVPDVMLKTMVDRITGLSDLTPEERLQRNQQKKQAAAAAAAAAAASKLFKAAPGAAPAAAGGGSSSAAAGGSSDVPEGLADDVRRMLQEAAAAVDSSNKLISGPAAAAGAEAEQANDGECDDSSSEENAEGSDPEAAAAAPKQPRKKRARRGPVDAAGEARAALVRAAAAAMAAAAAAGSSRGAAAPVVTEGLAAAGLWEEGDGELQIRPGGAAAAGGGGTKWQRFAGKGGGGCGGGGRGGGGGSGGRGRGRAKKFIVSDDEDDFINDDSSSEDYADVNSGVDDSDADDVILGESDGEDDGSAHKQSSRGKGDRGSSGRAQARMASLKRAAAVTAAAKVAAATAGYEEGEESEEDSDSPTAAAGVHVEDLGDIDPAMAAAMPGFQFKAAAAAGDKDADDDCVIEDEDEIMGVNELPAFKRAAKKRKGAAAAAAGEDFVIDLSQDDDPQPSAAADPEPAAVVGKKRGRKSKAAAAAPAGKAAAADDDVVITVSSRGRVRKVKKLADFYVDPTEVEGPASQPAAAAAEPESEQQHSEQHEEAEEPAEAEAAADEADAPASPAAASGSPAAATTAAEGPQDHDMDNAAAAAAAADMAEQQQEAPEEPDAEGFTAAAAGVGDEDMADAAAEVAEQQQEQAAQPAASEGRAATAATAGGATASPVKASKQPAEPAAAVDAQPDEAAIKSRVLELLSSQPPGSTLSVKAIRLAVQSATGWVLASAADKAAVKAACHAFVEQQQQQQEEVVGSNPAPGAVFAKDAQAGLKAAVAQVLAQPGAADKSMRIVRDEVAALLGLTALQAKEHRDSIKQLVRAQLGAQGAAEAAAADGAAAAAGKEEEARSAGSSHSQQQQNEAAAAATAGEASDCVEEEEILGVDELPEFRPRKAAAGRNRSKKSTSKAGCKQQSAPAAPAENEDEGGKHSLSGDDLDAFVVEGEDRDCDRGTRARSSSKHSSSSSKKRGRSSKQQQSEADAAAAAATAAGDKEEEEGAGEVTAPTAAAAAAAAGPSSKRQRLHRSAAAAGLEDFEVPMPDVDVDASLEDPNLLDALMDELTSPAADASPAAAADGPAAAAVGSGAKAADGQGGSPVPADMFDDTPSPQGLRKAGSASSTGTTAVVQVPAWGLRKKRSGLSATAAAAAEGTADAAGAGQAGRGHGAGGHRRARVIADSDDEGDGEQHQGPVAADTAAAAAELAELKQQLAAVLAQVAELQKAQANSPPQQQEQQQQQGPTEVAAAAAAQESLQQQLVQLQQQREVEAAAKAAAESEAARLREERAALQKQLCQQQQDEAAAAAEGAKVAQLQAELEALKQQQQEEAECAAVAKQTAAAAVAAAQKAEVEDRLAQLLQQQQQQEMAAVYEQQQEQRATVEQLLAAEAEREGLTAQLAALKQQHETELAALRERLAAAEAAAESPRFAVPAPAFTATVDGTPMGKATAAFGTGEAAAGATVSKQENLTPITPGTAPEAAAAAAEPGAADGSSAKDSLAGSFPGFGSPMGAKTCGFPVFAKPLAVTPVTVTLDDVRACLGDYPSGVTAVQLLQAFGASGSSSTSSKSLVEVLCAHLQCLVDDVEVIRKGGKAACSSKVDMDDAATLFIPLC